MKIGSFLPAGERDRNAEVNQGFILVWGIKIFMTVIAKGKLNIEISSLHILIQRETKAVGQRSMGWVQFISEKGPGKTRQKRALGPSRAHETVPYWEQPV